MWVDVEQNSDEWFNLRMNKATASMFGTIMANMGKPFGKPAISYAQTLALEIVTGEMDETQQMKLWQFERGHEFEPVAKQRYELETLNKVTNGGFFVSAGGRVGDSNDGNVGEKGCIEIKCVVPKTQFVRLEKGGIDSTYKWQIMGHIWIGKKEWCDFVSFCPEMNYKNQILITRVYRDEEIIKQMTERFKHFFEKVDFYVDLLNKDRKVINN